MGCGRGEDFENDVPSILGDAVGIYPNVFSKNQTDIEKYPGSLCGGCFLAIFSQLINFSGQEN